MPQDFALPRDKNGTPLDVKPLDFGTVLDGLVTLANLEYTVTADSMYRVVGETDLYYVQGAGGVAAVTTIGARNCAFLPANNIEFIYFKPGQTTLSVASALADGGCFSAVRVG